LNEVFKAIYDKTRKKEGKITERAIRYRIYNYQKKAKIVSKKLAENAYAYEVMQIALDKYISSEELKELQDWLNKKSQQLIQVLKPEKRQVKIREIQKKVIDAFNLPPNLLKEANKMADVYPDIYELENLVRHVIKTILEDKYGSDWWKNRNVVSGNIAERVEERMNFEGKNRWVAKRGTHEIFYTLFGDLSRIIASNPREFKQIFANMEIEAELRKLEPLRNIIAHNNPLPPKEINRIKTCRDDLREQLKNYTERKKNLTS
jgi:hypothetical protein